MGAEGKYDLVEAGAMECPTALGPVVPLPQQFSEVLNPTPWSQLAVYVPIQTAMPYWSYPVAPVAPVVLLLAVLPSSSPPGCEGGYDEDWLEEEAALNEWLSSTAV